MAVIMSFVSWYVFKLVSGKNASITRYSIAAFIAGYTSLNVAALVTAIEFGIQPIIASGADGNPLYAPYPLRVAIPAMAFEHLIVFGFVEAIVSLIIFRYFYKTNKDFIEVLK